MANHFYLRIDFREQDNATDEDIEKLIGLMADALEFRKNDPNDNFYADRGWGISGKHSHNLIVKVRRFIPGKKIGKK